MHFTYTDKDILDGRFEFKQSGTFRVLSPFATLKAAIACIIEVMIAPYTLSVLIGGSGAMSNNTSIIVIKIALAVVLPILPIWYILIVAGGEKQYKYTADNRMMIIKSKRETYIFKYTDIVIVTYKPMTLFGKQKGYTVTVTTKNATLFFRYIMPSNAAFFTIQSTPFYILQNPPQQAKNQSAAEINSAQ